MQFVVDEEIPFGRDAFSHLGSVTLLPGRAMTREALREAHALIVRSVTKVDATLLADTNVQFVGTATTGVEHIDREYLAARDIGFAAALGCNANAVAEYVLTALLVTAHAKGLVLSGKTLGIIGVGRIGSLVAAKAPALGMQTLLHDPPLARATGDQRYQPLAETLQADFVTLHVPLTLDGPDATFHLIGADELAHMAPSSVLINTARGEVMDNAALLKALTGETLGGAVMDVWEREPSIDWNLLNHVTLGTPHVAGYSSDAKINGTVMLYHACCRFWGIEPVWTPPPDLPTTLAPVTLYPTSRLTPPARISKRWPMTSSRPCTTSRETMRECRTRSPFPNRCVPRHSTNSGETIRIEGNSPSRQSPSKVATETSLPDYKHWESAPMNPAKRLGVGQVFDLWQAFFSFNS